MNTPSKREPILKAKRNFWRRAHADKVKYLIDAQAFFRAFFEAAQQAERTIYIVGWDTDSRVDLLVSENQTQMPVQLKDFLIRLCEQKPNLNVYVLSWDFNFIFSLEREAFPQLKFEWNGHPRLHYHLDSAHPSLGSHHQKVVVIDDKLAFSGGLDITARRWDTSEHKSKDSRRIDPWGKSYGPFHDVQIAVSGKAASALGDLARERWRRAKGETLAAPSPTQNEPWISGDTDIEDVDVAISRTIPAMPGVHEVREVEYLFLDSISAAKKFIYLEAQYFSSKSISRAIARRLREPNGPEIVMVLARDATGWIEESTMSVLRQRVLDRIRKSDRYNRFRIYHPVVPDLDEGYVKVHSKVTIIDDQFARIGSANLNQRSMGLDTECDVSFEANGDERISQAIGKLRTRLLSEHLGVEELKFEEKFIETKSLIKTVEFFLGGPRTLVEFEREIPAWLDLVVPGSEVIDPNRPYRISRFKKYFPNLTANVAGRVHWLGRFKFATLIIILCLLFVAWKWTPLAAWIQPERISVFLDSIRENPMGPLLIILTFIIGGLVMVPVMALTVATGLTFEPLQATVLTLIGSAVII